MLRGIAMTNATNFLPCFDIETRKQMWVVVKNGEQLGVFDSITIASSFGDCYADDHKPVVFQD
jgi:hypothetical protein